MRSLTKGTGSGTNKRFLFMLGIIFLEFVLSYLPFVTVSKVAGNIFYNLFLISSLSYGPTPIAIKKYYLVLKVLVL